nr:ATP-dependent DNA helicase [Nanchangia anserum]
MKGEYRAGQERMCEAIATAVDANRHIMVQAGTGTGKSLGYLAAVLPAATEGRRVVISTATKALQRQLVTKDIPMVSGVAASLDMPVPDVAALKGWSNYACVYKLRAGEDDGGLFEVADAREPGSRMGKTVVKIRAWAEETDTGDRDDVPFTVSDKAWRYASISPRECPGDHCPLAAECFPRRARARALAADVVVTNHALLGVDAFSDSHLLGDVDIAVIDEAHDLIDRIRQAASAQLTPAEITSLAARLARGKVVGTDDLREGAKALREALTGAGEGLLTSMPEALGAALGELATTASTLMEDIPTGKDATATDRTNRSLLADLREAIEHIRRARMDDDALWVSMSKDEPHLNCAPIDVAPDLARTLLAETTTVFTSATLALGGSFKAVAAQIGLPLSGARYDCLDVGSPFPYASQGITYIAAHLERPGRSGLSDEAIDELLALAKSSGGGMLGLFSSHRALSQAAEAMGDLDFPVYVQGDDQLPTLVRAFTRETNSCLLGTLSLWQGVDVPGLTCRLVIIDRIPFPRPDDPLIQARSQAVEAMGGSSFQQVSLTHAALLLAQGAGRLIRSQDDRGMVAILDSRLAHARYRGYLRKSLPGLWPTEDAEIAHAALSRLAATLATDEG